MKKPALIITFTVIIVLFLLMAKILVANSLSIGGVQLSKIERQIRSYQIENALLKEKVVLSSSLTHIASKAAKLGFVENKSTFALIKSQPLAKR